MCLWNSGGIDATYLGTSNEVEALGLQGNGRRIAQGPDKGRGVREHLRAVYVP